MNISKKKKIIKVFKQKLEKKMEDNDSVDLRLYWLFYVLRSFHQH